MKLSLAALLLCAVSVSAQNLEPASGSDAPGGPVRSSKPAHEDANASHGDALKSAMSWLQRNEYKELPFAMCESKKSKGAYVAIGQVHVDKVKESQRNGTKCWTYSASKRKYVEALHEGKVLYDQAGDHYFLINPIPDIMPKATSDGDLSFAHRLKMHIEKATNQQYSITAGTRREQRQRTVDDIGN